MENKHQARARKIIAEISYLNIATITPEGNPWNSMVYYAYDEDFKFYWASYRYTVHSQNIVANEKAFITIYDSSAPEGTGDGVYMDARATEVMNEQEIEYAVKLLGNRKFVIPLSPFDYVGQHPRRKYKAIPLRAWINKDEHISGTLMSTRVPVALK